MVFARSRTRIRNLPTFKFGNLDLDLVDDYVYLGICFDWNGSFFKAKKLLHDKASKAMYSRTPLLRPPSKSDWSGRKRGVVVHEGLDYFITCALWYNRI